MHFLYIDFRFIIYKQTIFMLSYFETKKEKVQNLKLSFFLGMYFVFLYQNAH
jgi:hypothetical protein